MPGGLGVLGCAGMSPDDTEAWIRRTKALTQKPFGIDIVLPAGRPPSGSFEQFRAQIDQAYWGFVEGMRKRYGIPPPKARTEPIYTRT